MNKPSEAIAIVAVIDPDANAAGALTSTWVPAKDFLAFMAICLAGTLGASATLDFKLQQATDASGTGAKDITGKAITQLTQAGTDSDKQAVINLLVEELDVDGGFTHVAMILTTGTATSDGGAVLLGTDARYAPASDTDISTVDEIVM